MANSELHINEENYKDKIKISHQIPGGKKEENVSSYSVTYRVDRMEGVQKEQENINKTFPNVVANIKIQKFQNLKQDKYKENHS